MMRSLFSRQTTGFPAGELVGRRSEASSGVFIFFGVFFGFLAWFLIGQDGPMLAIILLGASVAIFVLSRLSWNNMALLIVLWLFTMSGFRTYVMIRTPVLPDFSLERILTIWILVLFSVQLFMRRKTFSGPYTLDILLLLHTIYILANLTFIGNQKSIHEWTLSSATPFFAYLFGKTLMQRDRDVRILMFFLLLVTIYYYVQSIAQRYDLNFLIWPRSILDKSLGFWPAGRSRGPFLHPPYFGQVMAMFFLVQFYFFYHVKGKNLRGLIIASIALSGLGLLFTFTRAPWVAAGSGILTLVILRPRYRQLTLSLAIVAAAASFFFNIEIADEKYVEDRLGNVRTIENRLAGWSAAVRILGDHPLFGAGYFKWKDIYWRYLRGEEIPFYGYVSRSAARYVVPHDMYWSRMAEEGIIGMGLLLTAIAIGLRRLRRLWREVPDHAWLNRDGLALFCAVYVSYLVGGFFIDYRYFDLVNAIPYLMAGILYGYQVPEYLPPPPPHRLWAPPSFASTEDQQAPTSAQE